MTMFGLVTALRTLKSRGSMQILRDGTSMVRQHFLFAAAESGLLEALRVPRTRDELRERLRVERPELLEALLDLGVSLRELSLRAGAYGVRGARSRALLGPDGDTMAAVVQAGVTYYNSVYRELPGRLRGGPRSDDLQHIGSLVARVSRLSEPFVRNFVRRTVKGRGPMRILEIGCGSGALMKTAWQANPELTGVGLDMDPDVVEQARRNLEEWGIGDRFMVLAGDVRNPPPELQGPFDVISLYNLVYYFSVAERLALFASLLPLLSSGGVVAIVSSTQSKGRDPVTANLDLATRSLVGCWPLPDLEELEAQLARSGYSRLEKIRLVPGSQYYGITARRDLEQNGAPV